MSRSSSATQARRRAPVLYDVIQRIPAGMMIVPTVIGAIIHTFCPQVLQIGNPTQVLFTSEGMQVCVGMMLFFTGTQLAFREVGPALRRVAPTLAFKLAVAYGLAGVFYLLFGLDGVGGVSFLTFAVAITSCNAVLFLATVRPWAGVDEYALFSMFMILSMPALPLLLMSGASGAGIDWLALVSCLAPLLFGVLVGNLDERFRELFSRGSSVVLPFFGFQFGSLVDLGEAADQVLPALGLIIAFYLLSAGPLFLFERLVLRKPGHVGVATCSVAGIAVSFPTMAATSSAVYLPYVDAAVSQLAMAMFVTALVTPFLAHLVAKRARVPRIDELAAEARATDDDHAA